MIAGSVARATNKAIILIIKAANAIPQFYHIYKLLLKGIYQGVKGALAPSKNNLPLSFEGEGDKGGEVDKNFNCHSWLGVLYFG